MDLYWLGVSLGIINGFNNNIGTLLQKSVVNQADKNHFGKSLVKSPIWLLGIALQFAISPIFVFFIQAIIGPSLLPELGASGLIILAIGSVKLLHESLKKEELIGIFMVIFGVILIGSSRLSISASQTQFTNINVLINVGIFTAVFCGLFLVAQLCLKLFPQFLSVCLILQSGFVLAISNCWMFLLIGSVVHGFAGSNGLMYILIFIVSCFVVVIVSMISIVKVQKSFISGQANRLIPIQYLVNANGPHLSLFLCLWAFGTVPRSGILLYFWNCIEFIQCCVIK